MNIGQWLLDFFFPGKCVFCGKLLAQEERDVCDACRLALPVFDGPEKSVTGAEQCVSVFYYEDMVRDGILRFKFQGKEHYGNYFGKLMAAAWSAKGNGPVDLVCWVPISRKRMAKRGYNQAKLLAVKAGKCLHLPAVPVLMKRRDNPAQSHLSSAAERRANVIGVYRPVDPKRWRGKHLLLVDDVVTTGSTLAECVRVLLTAGAASVRCLTLAGTRENKVGE